MKDIAVDDVVPAICQPSTGELMKSLSGQLVVRESEMNELVANCDRSRAMQSLQGQTLAQESSFDITICDIKTGC